MSGQIYPAGREWPIFRGSNAALSGECGLDCVEAADDGCRERADLADVDPHDIAMLETERRGRHETGPRRQDHAVWVDIGMQEAAHELVIGSVQLGAVRRAAPDDLSAAGDAEPDRQRVRVSDFPGRPDGRAE